MCKYRLGKCRIPKTRQVEGKLISVVEEMAVENLQVELYGRSIEEQVSMPCLKKFDNWS